MTTVAVTHNAAASRFEAVVDGQPCVCQYRLYGKLMMFTHTAVPHVLRGRGIAAELARVALEHARTHGFKVRPDCSYIESYMQRHRETQDLLLP
jgi:predicted GNAT family acetyltransferase